MANLETITIRAPGFAGLNTQDSPTSLPPEYASKADNCVIDKFGRVAARKGYNVLTTSGNPAETIKSIGHYIDEAGNEAVYSATTVGIYTGVATMSSSLVVASEGNWQMLPMQNWMIFLQRGEDPLRATDGGAPVALGQTAATNSDSLAGANCGLAAFSRLWLADTTNNSTILYWSDLRDPTAFNTGSAGLIDLTTVWPAGRDEIVALASHNGYLIIFGRNNILVYQGADDPATMVLSDTVGNVGCVARDSVQSTGNDLLFLSNTGLRSFGRTIQEETMPNREISGNVRDDVIAQIPNNINEVKTVYSPEEGFYILLFPTTEIAYVFDLRRPLETGYLRATRWPNCPFFAFTRDWDTGVLYVAGSSGVGKYFGYTDNGEAYQLEYNTTQMDFGDPAQFKFLKKVRPIIIGATNDTATLRWAYDFNPDWENSAILPVRTVSTTPKWNISFWNLAVWGIDRTLNILNINTTGSGAHVKVGIEAQINGSEFSIQELTHYATIGRKVW